MVLGHGCERELSQNFVTMRTQLKYFSRQLGLELKGDSANVYWGAFDAVIKSDVRSNDGFLPRP